MPETILETVARLSRRVDYSHSIAADLLDRYNGNSPLSYLSPEAKAALGDRLTRVSANFSRVAVDELAQRMRIVGLTANGQPHSALWADWKASGMIAGAQHATKGALITGRSAMSVWVNRGRVVVRPESATQTAWTRDPVTGWATEGFKRWRTPDGRAQAVLYLPGAVVSVRSKSHVPDYGPSPAGLWLDVPADGWEVVAEAVNPLGVPLLVPITNALTIESAEWGDSEISPLIAMNDLLEKLLTDSATASEGSARPVRFASGLEQLPEDDNGNVINPFESTKKVWIAAESEVKFGQLPSDIGGFDRLISMILQMLAGLSGLPANVLGVSHDNPTSADAIAASGLTLTSRAEDRNAVHDPDLSRVAALAVALKDGGNPLAIDAGVVRADPRYSSEAAEADAVTKLVQSGILSRSAALRRLGYSPDEITAIEADVAREQALKALLGAA